MSDSQFQVIRVAARAENGTEIENRQGEIERYIYGRGFALGYGWDNDNASSKLAYLYFLVERHYAKAICDRLASGLFGASIIDDTSPWVG
jgi:hypothetical protein